MPLPLWHYHAMCGINGVLAKSEKGKTFFPFIYKANDALSKRGPDSAGIFIDQHLALGHRRLSIIDLSASANQPMWDTTKKYVIVFNGEIFNYIELKNELIASGVQFATNSDTEVLLELYKKYQASFINRLNGFFAFALYDVPNQKLLLARDRYGIKPLWYFEDDDVFVFSSELKGLLQFPIARSINHSALFHYLHLNYVPADESMLCGINKHTPGTFKMIAKDVVIEESYYQISNNISQSISYEEAKAHLVNLMDDSVKRRLISDVPIGAFLSGGIDSSVIVALASRHTNHLNTFSIGYKNESFYDETHYAELVADRYKTNHTVFKLTSDDVFNELDEVLNYFDEPFADSSALPVYLLCKNTKDKVKVALSGDGADELFGGYMKHWAEYKVRHQSFAERALVSIYPSSIPLPYSRGNYITNKLRQLHRFVEGAKQTAPDRYLSWCSIGNTGYVSRLLRNHTQADEYTFKAYGRYIQGGDDLNDVLLSDMKLVLPGDMLVKVDLMSMANSLEVRVPFLDYRVVDFAFTLPSIYKVDRRYRKKIVQDAFKSLLPDELYNRPKKGFEMPLLEWMRGELFERMNKQWLNKELIEHQQIFNFNAIQELTRQLKSANPGDSPAKLWAIIQFQNFWLRYF